MIKIIMTKEDYDINVEQLLLEKINTEQEIERLNKEREIDIKYNKYLRKELAKANSIIKEVREWILYQQEHSMEPYIATDMLDDILEILDKVGIE